MIDPNFWQSETIASYPLPVRYFFIGLFSNADDQGRLRAHPALLRSLIYPYDDIDLNDICAMLELLSADDGPIMLYQSDGRDLLQIVNWWRWQHPSWAWPSDLEPPPGWVDRHCYRKGNAVVKENWDQSDPTVTPERAQSEVRASNAPSTSTSIRDSTSIALAVAPDQNGADARDAVGVLRVFGMNDAAKVRKETRLEDWQIVETVAYAKQEKLGAGWVRNQLRLGNAYRPRAPDNGPRIIMCPTCHQHPCDCEES